MGHRHGEPQGRYQVVPSALTPDHDMLHVMTSANPLGGAVDRRSNLGWESNAICQPANLHKRAQLRDLSEWRSGLVAQGSSPVAHATCTPLVPILHRIADVSLLSLWRSSKEYSLSSSLQYCAALGSSVLHICGSLGYTSHGDSHETEGQQIPSERRS